MLRLSAIGFFVFLNSASIANALTCEGWKARCVGECPAAEKLAHLKDAPVRSAIRSASKTALG
jgi:hypothetical protein